MTSWRCPVCREPLVRLGAAWRCGRDHSFDVAREGYVNLLVTHQRRARPPGDAAEMVAARRRFLDGGWYEPLRDLLRDHEGAGTTLDAGCGEGYYTRGWTDVWGIDIAKPAVRLAARRATGAGEQYAVASVYDVPLADESADVVVSVFAPLHAAEFERVLRPGGRAVVVTPGPDHLAGLAVLLFDVVEPHPAEPPFDRPGATTSLRSGGTERLRYDLTLDGPGAAGDLLGMTPYAWYVSAERRASVSSLASLSTTVDFLVTTYYR